MGSVVVVIWHMESSQIRDRTHVPCIGRRILNHWTVRGIQLSLYVCFGFFLASPCGMRDLSSLTTDWTCAPCVGSTESTTGPPGKSPSRLFTTLSVCVCMLHQHQSQRGNHTAVGDDDSWHHEQHDQAWSPPGGPSSLALTCSPALLLDGGWCCGLLGAGERGLAAVLPRVPLLTPPGLRFRISRWEWQLQFLGFGEQQYGIELPWWLPEPTCQRRRLGFDPWVGKLPWRRKWQPGPVSLPGKSHGNGGCKRVGHNLATKQSMELGSHRISPGSIYLCRDLSVCSFKWSCDRGRVDWPWYTSEGWERGTLLCAGGGFKECCSWKNSHLKRERNFPSGPVVKTPSFHYSRCRINPWLGN